MCRAKLTVIAGLLVVILAAFAAYGDYEGIESLESYDQKAAVVNFKCKLEDDKETTVKIEVCMPDIIRVRMSPTGDFAQPALVKYGIVKTDWPKVDFTVKDEEDFVRIETDKLIVKVGKSPFKLSFLDKTGKVIAKESKGGIRYDKESGKVIETFRLPPDEHFFGFSPRTKFGSRSDMRGEEFTIRVGGPGGGQHTENRLNFSFFMSTNGYGIFLNTTWPQVYNFGEESEEHYWLEVKGGDLDYYFIYGPSFKVILDRYTDITGKAPLPPKWAFGTWTNTYSVQETVLEIARRYRKEGLPVDVFRIDSCWMAQEPLSMRTDELEPLNRNISTFGMGYDALKWDRLRYPEA